MPTEIRQIQPLPAPQQGQIPIAEYGLTGAVVLLFLQRGWQWFSNKEDSESKLIHTLIESLQSTQSQLLQQLVETQNGTNKAILGLKTAVDQLNQQMKIETANIARMNHLALRDISARLDKLDGLGAIIDEDDIPTEIRGKKRGS